MRRFFEITVAIVIMALLVFSMPGVSAALERLGGYTVTLGNNTLNDTITNTSTAGVVTLGNAKTAFFVVYTEMLANQSTLVVPQISYDGTTWINQTFYDIAGGATLQTAENITANVTTYYFWLPESAIAPYTRINMTAHNTTASNTTNLLTYMVAEVNQR